MLFYVLMMFLSVYINAHSGGLNCLDVFLLTTAVLLVIGVWLDGRN